MIFLYDDFESRDKYILDAIRLEKTLVVSDQIRKAAILKKHDIQLLDKVFSLSEFKHNLLTKLFPDYKIIKKNFLISILLDQDVLLPSDIEKFVDFLEVFSPFFNDSQDSELLEEWLKTNEKAEYLSYFKLSKHLLETFRKNKILPQNCFYSFVLSDQLKELYPEIVIDCGYNLTHYEKAIFDELDFPVLYPNLDLPKNRMGNYEYLEFDHPLSEMQAQSGDYEHTFCLSLTEYMSYLPIRSGNKFNSHYKLLMQCQEQLGAYEVESEVLKPSFIEQMKIQKNDGESFFKQTYKKTYAKNAKERTDHNLKIELPEFLSLIEKQMNLSQDEEQILVQIFTNCPKKIKIRVKTWFYFLQIELKDKIRSASTSTAIKPFEHFYSFGIEPKNIIGLSQDSLKQSQKLGSKVEDIHKKNNKRFGFKIKY